MYGTMVRCLGTWALNELQKQREFRHRHPLAQRAPETLAKLELDKSERRNFKRVIFNTTTVESRYTGPKSNGNPPMKNAKLWSLQIISFSYVGYNKNSPITDKIDWSLDIRYSEV